MFRKLGVVAPLIARLTAEIGAWEGVRVRPHERGGTEFAFGKGEIGHVHSDGTLDVPFPKRVRDDLLAVGEAKVHRWVPDSGWVTYPIRSEHDVPHAVALLRRSYDLRLAAKAAHVERQERRSV